MTTKRVFLHKKCTWFLLFVVALVAALYFYWVRNPLPKDEEMIAHFYANKADFEELVKIKGVKN